MGDDKKDYGTVSAEESAKAAENFRLMSKYSALVVKDMQKLGEELVLHQRKQADISQTAQDAAKIFENELGLYKSMGEAKMHHLEQTQLNADAAEQELRSIHARIKAGDTELIIEGELTDLGKEMVKNAGKKARDSREVGKQTQDTADKTRDYMKLLTGIDQRNILRSLWESEDAQKAMLKTMGEMLKPGYALDAIMSKIGQATMKMVAEFSQATSELNALTGAAGEYDAMLIDVHDHNARFGIDTTKAAAAVGALHQDMANFTTLNKDVQQELVTSTARMERLGIAASTTAATFQELTLGFAFTAEEANAISDDMAKTAIGIGIPPKVMSDNFRKAMPQLAKFGKEAPAIFKKVAAASKKLGIEVDSLLGLTSQFDTFEGSAQAAGKLNAMLGGDLLNAYDLMNASADEQIEMLLGAVDASGKSWDSMNKFEKQAIANAAGITDMAEAQKLFEGGIDAYSSAQEELEAAAVSQEDLADAQAASVSIGEKFERLMKSFALAILPVVNFLTAMIDKVLWFNDVTGGWMVPMLLGVIGVWYALSKVMAITKAITVATTGAQVIAAGATGGLSAAQAALAASNTSVASTALPAAGGIKLIGSALAKLGGNPLSLLVLSILMGIALGFGMIAIGAGIVIYSLVKLMGLFMEMPMMILPALFGLVGFGLALYAFVALMNAMLPLAFGAALAMTVVGIGMMRLAIPLILFGAGMFMFGLGLQQISGNLGTMILFAAALPLFALALAFSAGPFLYGALAVGAGAILLGVGLAILGMGLQQMEGMWSTMVMLSWALPLFGLGLALAAYPFLWGAMMIAPGALLLGLAFMALGTGLQAMEGTWGTMAMLAWALPLFAYGLMYAGLPLLIGAIYAAPAALLIGLAFIALGAGLKSMEGTAGTMAMLAWALPLFGWGLFAAGFPMYMGAIFAAPAALFIGLAFLALGAGLKAMDGTVGIMLALAAVLPLFGWAMFYAGFPMLLGAIFMAPAAALLGLGFMILGKGLKEMEGTWATMLILSAVLPVFGLAMAWAGRAMLLGAIFMAPASLLLGLGFMVLGKGLKSMEGTWGTMLMLALILPFFALSLMFAAPMMMMAAFSVGIASMMLGWGFGVLGDGLRSMEGMVPTMFYIAAVLPFFALALLVAAPMMMLAAIGVGLSSAILGWGFQILGEGLLSMYMLVPTMFYIAAALPFFALALLFAAPLLAAAALSVGVASLLLGWGFQVLGEGLRSMAGQVGTMFLIAAVLPIFAWSLIWSAFPLLIAAAIITPALFLLGWGFQALGKGLAMMADVVPVMGLIESALPAFAWGILEASKSLGKVGFSFYWGALWVGLGLGHLSEGLRGFGDDAADQLTRLGNALPIFGWGVFLAAIPLGLAGVPFMLGAMTTSIGLAFLGWGLKQMPENAAAQMAVLGVALPIFGWGIFLAAIPMFLAGPYFLAGAIPISFGLAFLGWGLKQMPDNAGEMMAMIGFGIVPFALGIFFATPFLFWAALPFLWSAILIGMAMTIWAPALVAFTAAILPLIAIAPLMPALGYGMMMLGYGLLPLAEGLWALGRRGWWLWSGEGRMERGIKILGMAIREIASALGTLHPNALLGFGLAMTGLMGLAQMDEVGLALFTIATGIYWIADALKTIPESKAIAFAVSMDSMTSMAVAASDITPEIVENTAQLVDQAERYQMIQAQMMTPDYDSFVQALTVSGATGGDKGSKGGKESSGKQDVVLVMNERELGRAVDAILKKKHNMRVV